MMKKEFSSPAIDVKRFADENVLTTGSETINNVVNTVTSNDNSTLTLGGKSNIDSTNLFAFKW